MKKVKTLFKYVIPISIVFQLLIILISIRADRAFQCKTWNNTLVCRQITTKG